jgi:hypothetical protein
VGLPFIALGMSATEAATLRLWHLGSKLHMTHAREGATTNQRLRL